eukprot:TRINITY_DN7964_c0_g1_i3.p1 TRINITY_DN7964_c0_g1~~TRINITY_DN7964_c0_g1_i3.p1  ORF type:complete len:661 (-),score=69.69 TRINITY_DN7964_c0_g1_i3:192-2174(-)
MQMHVHGGYGLSILYQTEMVSSEEVDARGFPGEVQSRCEDEAAMQSNWTIFQRRLRNMIEEHHSACERLAEELLEGVGRAPLLIFSTVPTEGKALSSHEYSNGVSGDAVAPRQVSFEDSYGTLALQHGTGSSVELRRGSSDVLLDEVCEPERRVSMASTTEISETWMNKASLAAEVALKTSDVGRLSMLLMDDDGKHAEAAVKLARGIKDEMAHEESQWSSGGPESARRLGASFVSRTQLHQESSSIFIDLTAHIEETIKTNIISVLTAKWSALREPHRRGCLASLEQHKLFAAFCATMIMANTLYIVLTTNRDMTLSASGRQANSQADAPAMSNIELFFFLFYLAELSLRLWVHRLHFFVNSDAAWNCLDFFLVLLSCFEVAISAAGDSNMSLMLLRILRLLKISKLLRIVRAVRFLSELRLFIDCLRGCAMSLFWAVIMIGLVLLLFALLFVQALANHLQDEGDAVTDNVSKDDIVEMFGSVESAILRLLELACGFGDWWAVYQVVAVTGPFTSTLFVFFTLFITIAVWNIVTSVFLENTMKMTQPDREGELLDKHRQDVEDAKELMQVCSLADADGSGTVSLLEFEQFMLNDTRHTTHMANSGGRGAEALPLSPLRVGPAPVNGAVGGRSPPVLCTPAWLGGAEPPQRAEHVFSRFA